MSDVYATARGPLARIAGPLAARARRRRHEAFFPSLDPGARVLDLGCGAIGLRALEPGLDITGVDIEERPAYPGPFVRADAAAGLPFADGEFDLVYCSSVIEHVQPRAPRGVRGRAAACRAGLARADACALVPDRAAFPLARRAVASGRPAPAATGGSARPGIGSRSSCSRARELEALFGPARAERFGPLAKSWVSVRAPQA